MFVKERSDDCILSKMLYGAAMDELLSSLSDPQREGVLHIKGPLLLLAGAGSGKTLVITTKIAHLIREHGVSPEDILAVTFTNKAAGEMKERVTRMVPEIKPYRLWVRTFHATCLRILKAHAAAAGYTQNFVILDESDRESALKKAMKDGNIILPATLKVSAVARAISDAKNNCIAPDEYQKNIRRDYGNRMIIAQAYAKYQAFIVKENAMDFDDLIMNTITLFESHPEICASYRNAWRYILIDEFQDTNVSQYRLVRLLADETSNITVVGDDDQSIYSFRGAEVKHILDFPKHFGSCAVIRLEENYRCPDTIVHAAFSIVQNNRRRHKKDLFSNKKTDHPIELISFDTDRDEAAYIANEIENLFSGGHEAHDIVILFRTNAQSRLFEKEFVARKIPYTIVGGFKFYERAEVKDALAYLRIIIYGTDNISFRRVINTPPRGMGEKSMDMLEAFAAKNAIPLFTALDRLDEIDYSDKGKKRLAAFRDLIRSYRERFTGGSAGAHIRAFMDDIDYYSVHKDEWRAEEAKENVAQLSEAVDEFLKASPGASIAQFLEEVQLYSSADEKSGDTVTLMTVHNAKGLEYRAVFLTGLENGVFPHYFSMESPDGLEEERRLCYVGMTRAKERLYLTNVHLRMTARGMTTCMPSLFLQELPEGAVVTRDVGSYGNMSMDIDDDAFAY